jgi:hypothetical protein
LPIEPSNASEGLCKNRDTLLVKLRATPLTAGEETGEPTRLCGLKAGVAANVGTIHVYIVGPMPKICTFEPHGQLRVLVPTNVDEGAYWSFSCSNRVGGRSRKQVNFHSSLKPSRLGRTCTCHRSALEALKVDPVTRKLAKRSNV